MYYNARWYDPYLNHMTQPDSIVPDPYNSQDYDRYAYVRNNPLRYTDPSGHVTCEGANWDDGPKCTQKSGFWQKAIKDTYDWNADPDFSLEELKTIYQTGRDIEKYVDDLTGGKGLEWMNFFIGGVNIVHWNGSNNQALPFPLFSSETTIKLNGSWISGADPKRWLAHEFGHIWDINTAHATTVAGAIGGVGDDLNALIGGSIATGPHTKSRFGNIYPASPYIPETYLYRRGSYANTSTADYLAETFALSIYHPNAFNKPELQTAQGWVTFFIGTQASLIP